MSTPISDHIKVVLFDHDDTLVGTFRAKSAHHQHVARTHYAKDLTEEEVKEHWGKPFQELLCLLYGTDDVEQAIANNAASDKDFPKVLFTASIPTLERLHNDGRKIGVITATIRSHLEHDLTAHGIPREFVDYTQTADDTPYHKPDPRVFDPALKWIGEQNIQPNEVVYVGDGLHDMKAALGAGFNFVGVETGLVTAEQFKEAGVMSVPSIADIFVDKS